MAEQMLAPNQTAPKVKGRWRTVLALSAGYFVDNLENFTLETLWPYMYKSMGWTIGMLGPITGIVRAERVLTTPLWGFLADRYPRKVLLVIMTGIWGLWTAAIGFVTSFSQLLWIRIISSIGLTAFWPIAFSLLGDLFPSKQRGRASSVMSVIGYTGNLLSYIVLPILAARGGEGWRVGFIAMGIASAVSGLIMLFVADPPRGSAEIEISDLVAKKKTDTLKFKWSLIPQLVKIKSWLLLMFHYFSFAMGGSILFAFLFTWLNTLNYSQQVILGATPILFVGSLVAYAGSGFLSDKMESKWPNSGRFVLGLISLLLIVIGQIGFILLGGTSISALYLFGFLTGIGIGSIETGVRVPLSQNVLPPELRATGRGLLDMVVAGSGALSLIVFGLVLDKAGVSFTMLLLVIPVAIFISTLFWLPILRSYPRDRSSLHDRLEGQRKEILKGE
jgi:MFS family permease